MAPQPKYVLIAGTDEDKKEVAKLQATLDEKEKEAKKAQDEKKDLEAKLQAIEEEDKVEHAKKAIKAAIDDEKDEEKKASMIKAMEDIFDTGNGVNTNAQETEKEKEQTAVIASLTADAAKPLITNILKAKKINGATAEALKAEAEDLTKLSYSALKAVYSTQEVYINKALAGSTIKNNSTGLVAKMESEFDFNGDEFSLTAKVVDLDEVRNL